MSHAELAAIISACFCALMSVSTIALMSHALGKARKARDGAPIDDPSLDATDAAHPAWWRGTDHAAARWAERTRKAERERDIIKAAKFTLAKKRIEAITLERDAAREELAKFKARMKQRAELRRSYYGPSDMLFYREWDWLARLPECPRADRLHALKHDHSEVMAHLRERARLP